MNNLNAISDEELHAYIDGALEEERVLAVRNALANDPALAGRIALFQADKALLKAAYAPLAERPLPPEWIARAHKERRPKIDWRWAAAIAAVILALAGGPLAWRYYGPARTGDVVEEALDARQNGARTARYIAANDQASRYDTALRQAVASNVRIPDLNRMGYKLRGLNLYNKAAEIVYQGPQNQLFTLYVRRSDGSARFDQFERRGLRICIWQDDQISTVMAGNISAAVMQRLATLSYTGLTS